jgi:hypothetical protein
VTIQSGRILRRDVMQPKGYPEPRRNIEEDKDRVISGP